MMRSDLDESSDHSQVDYMVEAYKKCLINRSMDKENLDLSLFKPPTVQTVAFSLSVFEFSHSATIGHLEIDTSSSTNIARQHLPPHLVYSENQSKVS